MLIESVSLESVGPFRRRVSLGPLAPGLNVLAQANEWGKSTVVRALCHGFFDRYRAEHDAIRQLRPAGSSLAPRIEVEFSARGERYQLKKRFLDGRSCELHRWNGAEWDRLAESDAADQRLRELLGAPALEGRTFPKPETWGLVRYLWCRQEDPPEWPDWEGETGAAARRKLATVEIDRAVRALAEALQEKAGELFAPRTGRVRAGGPLDIAEKEAARLETELAAVRKKRAELQALEGELARSAAELPRLQAELAEKKEAATRSQAAAELVERLQAALAEQEQAFARADAALQQVGRDEAELKSLALAEKKDAEAEQAWQVRAARHAQAAPALQTALEAARAAQRAQVERRGELAARARQVQGWLRWREAAEEATQLAAVLERSRTALAELAQLRSARARIPAIAPASLKHWRKLETGVREDRVRLSAAALTIALEPERAAAVQAEIDGRAVEAREIEAGERATWQAMQAVSLHLPGWGRVEISSGAGEPAKLAEAIAAREAELHQALSAAGVRSIAEAEAHEQQARKLDGEIKIAEATAATSLGSWKSLGELELRVTALTAARDQQAGGEEAAERSLAALRTESETLSAGLSAAADEEARLGAAIEEAHQTLNAHALEAAALEAERAGREDRARQRAVQDAFIRGRYPGGIADALSAAQREFVRAEARLGETRRELPPEAAKAQVRAERAARAAVEVEADFRRRQDERRRLEIILGERGAEGLYSREGELEEKLELAGRQAAEWRRQGRAARLLVELIRRREQSAIRHVLRPLEDRLSAVFAGLTGVPGRRVWFDEDLRVEGVGRTREEMVRFDDLSRGAREQLLLGLRAAIALELAATDGPQCLILDDVLVHTDAARHQNVLDYLQELAGRVQILLLTCHAERYRGAGAPVRVVQQENLFEVSP